MTTQFYTPFCATRQEKSGEIFNVIQEIKAIMIVSDSRYTFILIKC
jgi:hypothetical protein